MKKSLFVVGILLGLVIGIALDNAVLGLLLGIVLGLIISGALKTNYRQINPQKPKSELHQATISKTRFDDGGFVNQDQQDHDHSDDDGQTDDEFYDNRRE